MTLRAAVLSAGAWSQHSHLPTLLAAPDVEVTVVTSPDATTREAVRRRWPGLTVTEDWQQSIATHDVDLVVVSSPPAVHVEQVVAALQHGAHVLVEKPFATTSVDARRMTRAAREADRELLVGYSWSSCPMFVAARAAVGRVGRIEHVDARLAVNTRDLLLGAPDGGWGGDASSNTATYTRAAMSGGGAGAVSMSHLLSMLLWITGVRPTEVFADAFPHGAAIDLHLASLLRCGSGTTVSTTTTSLHAGAVAPEWSFQIHGEQGDLVVDSVHRDVRFIGSGAAARWEQLPVDAAPLVDQHLPTRSLIDVARGEAVDLSGLSGELGERVVAITEASYRSSRERRVCSIDPASDEQIPSTGTETR